MSFRTLTAFDVKQGWPSSWGTTGTLVITLDRGVVGTDAVEYPKTQNVGRPLSTLGFHFESAITVSSGVGTCASISNLPTTDTAIPVNTARYNIYIYDSKGKMRETLGTSFHLHESVNGSTTTFTWQQWVVAQQFSQGNSQLPMIGDRTTMQAMVDAALNAHASNVLEGILYLDTAPALASHPEAVGTNSTLLTRPLGYFNVKSYGTTGTINDTATINAAIDAFNLAGRGVLYFPAGDYTVTGALHAITATGLIRGEGRSDANAPSIGIYGTRINCSSPTATLFTINSPYLKFEDMVIRNASGTTPTTGAGILVTNASNAYQKVDFYSLTVEKFYDNISIEVGDDWRMHNCWILTPVRYGVRIQNTIVNDTGGWSISDSAMVSTNAAAIAVRVESCGGAKISNTNILGYLTAVQAVGSTTSVLLISNCSFEAEAGTVIDISGWGLVSIQGVEFGQYGTTTAQAIRFDNVNRSTISNVILRAPTSSGVAGITLNNCVGITLGTIHNSGYRTAVEYTGTYSRDPETQYDRLPATLVNGWTNVGGAFFGTSYGTQNNKVFLNGQVGSGTLNTTIFTLPVGFRPAATMVFMAPSGTGSCQIFISSDGQVKQQNGSTNTSVSLDGITFVP